MTAAALQHATASDAVAAHVATLRIEDIDAATLSAARWRVLDVLGCALGGTRADGCAALVDITREAGGAPAATVIGAGGLRTSAGQAAMSNAILARSFDYEVMGVLIGDASEARLIPSHHAASTVPTALALCEARSMSGAELLTAVVIGDDIAARTLAASGLDFGQGWDGAATYAALGAAAAASRLLGLTALQTRHALGLVVEQIGGTIQGLWDGATAFKLGQGTAARNAVLAAQLAQRGWTGMADPLQGRHAFYAQYTAGCADPGILVRELGRRYWAEAYFKPYPACMATHVVIEAALAARGGAELSADEIEDVVVRVPAPALANFCAKPYAPREREAACAHAEAIFSYAHMAACALLRGGVAQRDYGEDSMRDPRLLSLVSRLRLEALSAGRAGAEVEVRLRSGTRLAGTVAAPSRSPLVQPASEAEIEEKFLRQLRYSGLLDDAAAEQLHDTVMRLEQQASLAPLVSMLAGLRREAA